MPGGRLVTSLRKDAAGRLWILPQTEVVRLGAPAGVDRYDTGVFAPRAGFFRKLFRDRDGNILVASSSGVLRVADGKIQFMARSESRRAGSVFAILDEPGAPAMPGPSARLAVVQQGKIVPCTSPRFSTPVHFFLRALDPTLLTATSNGLPPWGDPPARRRRPPAASGLRLRRAGNK